MIYKDWIDARIRIDSHTISGTPRFEGTRLSIIMIAKYVERFVNENKLVECISDLIYDYDLTLEDCVYSYEWYCQIMNIDMKEIDIEQLKLYITFS